MNTTPGKSVLDARRRAGRFGGRYTRPALAKGFARHTFMCGQSGSGKTDTAGYR